MDKSLSDIRLDGCIAADSKIVLVSLAHRKADHTPVEDVGRIAEEAGVKTLVLSHLSPAFDSISDDTWRAPAAKYFKGEIIVGKELMVV